MEGVSEHLVAVGGSAGLITSVSVLHTEWNILLPFMLLLAG